ncbi:hypothetical protein Q0Z83_111920 [Actinoplanes sichuanensis]|nr:hypothetical protein Q0Z83_111920 [Actinoplanes sichuanensis]
MNAAATPNPRQNLRAGDRRAARPATAHPDTAANALNPAGTHTDHAGKETNKPATVSSTLTASTAAANATTRDAAERPAPPGRCTANAAPFARATTTTGGHRALHRHPSPST